MLSTLEDIRKAYNKPVSLADLIVLGGAAALEPTADGFRKCLADDGSRLPAETS